MRDRVQLARAPEPLEHRLERCNGAAELRFAPGGPGRGAALERLYQRSPCRVLFPRPEEDDLPTAVLLTTSGGLTGGDRLALAMTARPGARAIATTQAAEKIYRSLEGDATIEVALEVGEAAWFEWLPQETILFERARLVRRTAVEVAPGGCLLAGEILVFGRTAHGERFARGRLHDGWRVRRGGRLVWADALHVEGDVAATLDHPAGFGGALAAATLLYVADDAADWLEAARTLLAGAASRAGATVVNGVLLARLIGRDARLLREDYARLAGGLRAAIAALPARLPRVWAT